MQNYFPFIVKLILWLQSFKKHFPKTLSYIKKNGYAISSKIGFCGKMLLFGFSPFFFPQFHLINISVPWGDIHLRVVKVPVILYLDNKFFTLF